MRYFVAVASHLHFGRAARALSIAQPSLSQQIRELERELGVELLRRNRRTVSVTEQGVIFLAEARRTLAQAGFAVESARRAARGEMGRLTVGFASLAAFDFLPIIIRDFRTSHPGVDLTLRDQVTAEQVANLKMGTIDAGFLIHMGPGDGFATLRVARLPLIAILPKNHRLVAKKRLRLADLANEHFITFPRETSPAYYDYVTSLCQQAGFTPNIVEQAIQPLTTIAMISAGVGMALMHSRIRRIRPEGVAYQELVERPYVNIFMAWRAQHESPALQAFVSFVRSFSHESQRDTPSVGSTITT